MCKKEHPTHARCFGQRDDVTAVDSDCSKRDDETAVDNDCSKHIIA